MGAEAPGVVAGADATDDACGLGTSNDAWGLGAHINRERGCDSLDSGG